MEFRWAVRVANIVFVIDNEIALRSVENEFDALLKLVDIVEAIVDNEVNELL